MNNLKDKIVSYIKRAQEDFGITLVTEDWGSKPTKCACPLGCVLLVNNIDVTDDAEQNGYEAADLLGVSENWIESFIYGFDADDVHPINQEAYQLGIDIRNEFNPTKHTNYVNNLDPMAVEFIAATEIK